MTLTNKDRNWLRGVGFIPREIDAFANAVDPAGNPQPPIDLTNEAWQDMMTSRKEWVLHLVSQGLTPQRIDQAIENWWARQGKFDPWDWLREQYGIGISGHKALEAIGYQEARRLRKLSKLGQMI